MAMSVYGLKRHFDMTWEDYQRMLARQGGRCAICPATSPGVRNGKVLKRFAVDHDHKTGQIRGLLCLTCNAGLGHLKDDPELVYAAYLYLLQFPRWISLPVGEPSNLVMLPLAEHRLAS
jgi:hypothetical protein